VKSMSYAMGVRKPGFLMVSMWNPVDSEGNSMGGNGRPTLKTQLCLLPDQIGILIRYAYFIGITLSMLLINAILTPFLNLPRLSPSFGEELEKSLLPISSRDISPSKRYYDNEEFQAVQSLTSSTSSGDQNGLAVRSNASSRTRSLSAGSYGLPRSQHADQICYNRGRNERPYANEYEERGDHRKGKFASNGIYERKRESRISVIIREAWHSIWRVTWVVMMVFLWLFWRA